MDKTESNKYQVKCAECEKRIWGLPKAVVSFAVVALVSAVVYRSVTAELNLQFDFPALLSLLLALFAVGLSALFYFKATEMSSVFYDNTYKFTSEVSQILRSIESGFGERLRHLDEGYTGIRDRFGALPFDVSKARLQEEEEKQAVMRKEEELQDMLNELADRAKLAESEKREVFVKLAETQAALAVSRNELDHIQQRIRSAEDEFDESAPGFSGSLTDFLEFRAPELRFYATSSTINREFRRFLDGRDSSTRRHLEDLGWLDHDGDLTRLGIVSVRRALESYDRRRRS